MRQEEVQFILKALRNIKFFSTFSFENIDLIINRFQKYSYPAGKIVINQGDAGKALFIIYRGKVEVLKKLSFFKKKVITTLKEGDFFGEMSLVTDTPTSATVRTIEPSEFFVILKYDFQNVLQQNPELEKEIKYLIERRKFEAEREI